MIDIPNKGFTHAGKFHADDVFATAFLKILNNNIEIQRGFDIPQDYDGIVYDIGFGEYDHHQQDSKVRQNNIPYAAFGLLFEKYGEEILDVEDVLDFDEDFIQPLDLSDNTGVKNDIADMINVFNPNWNENKNTDEAFFQAVEVAKTILERNFLKIKSAKKAYNLLKPDIDNAKDNIVILTHFAPWRKSVKNTSIEFVIFHSQRGGFCAQAVNDDNDEMKIPFPSEWCGKQNEELVLASNIEELRFCHKSGFLVAGNTIQSVLDACKFAQNNKK